MQLAVRIPTTIVIIEGRPNPYDGTYPSLMFSKKKRHGVHWAFLVHGMLRFR
jgi:hypothetical protein